MNKSKKIIIIFILILLFMLLGILTIMSILLKREEIKAENEVAIPETVITDKIPKTVQDVIEKYDSKYISESKNNIYVVLAKDLYDEKGKSNIEFFQDLAKDLKFFFPKTSFYIIDEEKDITIFCKKREENEEDFDLIFNNNENFYEETDGRDYVAVEKSKIVEPSNLLVSNIFLERLEINSMYFKYIEKHLTNGRDMEDGYIVYSDQHIKVKLAPNKSVFNLVFMEDYEDKILHDVSLDTKLSDMAKEYEDYAFGGLDKEYLGYRSGNFYYFFYENEASIYPYSYKENDVFEQILTTYLETKDLDDFVDKLKLSFKGYSDFEYDADIQKLYISYPTRGIKIDIQDNDPKGITLYSNYHFSDMTKKLVKNGKLNYSKDDYVNEYEQMRKAAK